MLSEQNRNRLLEQQIINRIKMIDQSKNQNAEGSKIAYIVKQFGLSNSPFYNRDFCIKIKDLILGRDNIELIQMLFAIIQKIKPVDPIIKIEDIIQRPNLYKVLYNCVGIQQIVSLNRAPCFEIFMYQNSLASIIVILAYSYPYFSPIKQWQISDFNLYLSQKSQKIYSLLATDPHQISIKILNYFKIQSGFKLISSQKYQSQINKINSQKIVSIFENNPKPVQKIDPLQFLMIKKQLWNDQFFNNILSSAMWIIAQTWLKILKQNCPINEKQNIEEYKTIQGLLICQFLLSLKYTNPMLEYYPVENKLLLELFKLPSFATIVLQFQSLLKISWINQIYREMRTIIFQENGFRLALMLKNSQEGNHNLQIYFCQLIISTAENEIKNKDYLSYGRILQIREVLSSMVIFEQLKHKINELIELLISK